MVFFPLILSHADVTRDLYHVDYGKDKFHPMNTIKMQGRNGDFGQNSTQSVLSMEISIANIIISQTDCGVTF
jgi:hypothetical protein